MKRPLRLFVVLALIGCGNEEPTDPPETLDLADIVGGGDGTGTGGDRGIDVITGQTTTQHEGAIACPVNTFVPAANPLVNGVFCPDGAMDESDSIEVSTEGTLIAGVPDWRPNLFNESAWDHIWNGTNTDVTTKATGPQLGMHANKGITFDLGAIRVTLGDRKITAFAARAAMGERSAGPANLVSFQVFVDGLLAYEQRDVYEADSAFDVNVALADDARFLTLVTAATGDIQGDWSYWDAPRLVLEAK
ncbi:MAG: NPCBM/NEW2 domain-containing protein [Deltaproteobacteria bacterium]